jgi:hypothetical protein
MCDQKNLCKFYVIHTTHPLLLAGLVLNRRRNVAASLK